MVVSNLVNYLFIHPGTSRMRYIGIFYHNNLFCHLLLFCIAHFLLMHFVSESFLTEETEMKLSLFP